MGMCNCKFYEIDLEAKREGEEWEAGFFGSMSEADRVAIEQWAQVNADDETSPLSKCGAYCMHLHSGKGYPGEHVYHCTAPGNEHIIHVDFNESEII